MQCICCSREVVNTRLNESTVGVSSIRTIVLNYLQANYYYSIYKLCKWNTLLYTGLRIFFFKNCGLKIRSKIRMENGKFNMFFIIIINFQLFNELRRQNLNASRLNVGNIPCTSFPWMKKKFFLVIHAVKRKKVSNQFNTWQFKKKWKFSKFF